MSGPAGTGPLEHHVVVATDRRATEIFIESVVRQKPKWTLGRVAMSREAIADCRPELSTAVAAFVDFGPDPAKATDLSRDLHAAHPALPIVALLCCPGASRPWHLRKLLQDGAVRSVIDLTVSADEAMAALQDIAAGGAAIHLNLGPEYVQIIQELLGRQPMSETDAQLLELVADGMHDIEIGRRLHMSPHTVKHRIEDLRGTLQLKNRVELAAWAGQHGFYARGHDHGAAVEEDGVAARSTRSRTAQGAAPRGRLRVVGSSTAPRPAPRSTPPPASSPRPTVRVRQ